MKNRVMTLSGRDTDESKLQMFPDGFRLADGGRMETQDTVHFFDDFLGPAIDETNNWATGEEGTANAIAINVALNGTCRINTGTAVDKRNVLATELNWAAARTLVCEFRFRTVTSDAGLLFFAGLSDSKDEGSTKLPIKEVVLASATFDAWASDFCGIAVNAEQSDDIYCVSGKNGTLQSEDSTENLTISTWYKVRIVLNSSGDAWIYIDDTLVADLEDAVTAADPLCFIIGGLITTGSTAALIDLDYIYLAQARSA